MAFAPTLRRLAFLPTTPRLGAFAPTVPSLARSRTHPNWTDPVAIARAAAKTASAPHKLRQKTEAKKKRKLQPGEADVLPDGLMRGEANRVMRARLRAPDHAADKDDHTLLAEMRAREYRLRGVVDGKVVGKRVYLPNFLFRLMPNHTPAGLPYNPFEATFRVPPSITKLDIRGYLHAVYGLDVTYIRTNIYDGYVAKRWDRKRMARGKKLHPTYKRVVVGLKEPFYYPLMVEDMSTAERTAKVAEWNERFYTAQFKLETQLAVRRLSLGVAEDADVETRRQILDRITQRRAERETLLQKNLKVIREEWKNTKAKGRSKYQSKSKSKSKTI